jgi:hypothetical protein
MGVGDQRHAPAALAPGKTRYPFYRRLGGSQGRSGRLQKISPPPGFDSRTFQSVASRYTYWAIPAPFKSNSVIVIHVENSVTDCNIQACTSCHINPLSLWLIHWHSSSVTTGLKLCFDLHIHLQSVTNTVTLPYHNFFLYFVKCTLESTTEKKFQIQVADFNKTKGL